MSKSKATRKANRPSPAEASMPAWYDDSGHAAERVDATARPTNGHATDGAEGWWDGSDAAGGGSDTTGNGSGTGWEASDADAPVANAAAGSEAARAAVSTAAAWAPTPSAEFESLKDVWFAQSGRVTEDEPVRARVAPAMAGVELAAGGAMERTEIVLGQDDRQRVADTTAYPWRCICSLVITAADDSRWVGTGWLIGPRTVVTAGHCVYIHERGGWVKHVEVIPGRDGGARPFGQRLATALRSVSGWTVDRRMTHDYGAILLDAEQASSGDLGHFGAVNLDAAELGELGVNLAGYPSDKTTGTPWFDTRSIRDVLPQRVVYDIDTAGGQSGAPVWHARDGEQLVVAIHTNGELAGNSGTRVTGGVLANLQLWRGEAG